MVSEVCRRFHHTPGVARGADAPAFAEECDEAVVPAVTTAGAGKAMGKDADPVTMAFWGALIMILTFVGFATALIGLVLLMPLLGHASWHAYRNLVDASTLPEREPR